VCKFCWTSIYHEHPTKAVTGFGKWFCDLCKRKSYLDPNEIRFRCFDSACADFDACSYCVGATTSDDFKKKIEAASTKQPEAYIYTAPLKQSAPNQTQGTEYHTGSNLVVPETKPQIFVGNASYQVPTQVPQISKPQLCIPESKLEIPSAPPMPIPEPEIASAPAPIPNLPQRYDSEHTVAPTQVSTSHSANGPAANEPTQERTEPIQTRPEEPPQYRSEPIHTRPEEPTLQPQKFQRFD
jgi:hypothetical protein